MEMRFFSLLLGIAILTLCQNAIAKNRLTDPLKIARECKTELELFCKGVRAGGQRTVNCLKARTAELSPACLVALQSTD